MARGSIMLSERNIVMSSQLLLGETRRSLAELARMQRVHISTAWRWVLRGCRGHRLESFAVGGKRYTTDEAFSRFISATNGQSPVAPAASRPPSASFPPEDADEVA